MVIVSGLPAVAVFQDFGVPVSLAMFSSVRARAAPVMPIATREINDSIKIARAMQATLCKRKSRKAFLVSFFC